ncbi:sensor histidine kinase [Solirubrobacter soli]|uniref:sensor histidine kinase n=1 Tax=Solirubrobacter soli TaxID=363832 RepID=UPI00048A02C6|nr:sensor histidine kinase [Solirubrobacter soli]
MIRRRRLTANQWFAISVALLVFVGVLGSVASAIALSRLGDARERLADRLDPAAITAEQIKAALTDQETGLRGFMLGRDDRFLDPYRSGQRDEAAALARLRAIAALDDVRFLHDPVDAVGRTAAEWRSGYAEPTIAVVRSDPAAARTPGAVEAGKERFDAFRAAIADLQRVLTPARESARAELDRNADVVRFWVLGTGIVILLSVAAVALTLRRQLVVPVQELARAVRKVARGEFGTEVRGSGAREVVDLGEDVDAMRARIVAELDALRVAEADLRRSNAELEQFAYVASHDLQEPLRKVASFCQLLQQRYGGQLDERADQYIAFAVDGARRMQDLINDLLAFSRVGRMEQPHVDVDCGLLLERVRGDLSRAIEENDAVLEVDGTLPTVHGDAGLLRLVFQNLIANAIKFRGEVAPRVVLSATRDGDFWRFRCIDNGIGIDAEYAERIFVLFQRLHPRTQYEGTGIGLAMCRKIVEYHGGRMWLDTDTTALGSGSTFYFTLPAKRPES